MGGSWRTGAVAIKAAFNRSHRTNESLDDVGFRCIQPFFLFDESEPATDARMGKK